jgi:hypothetical protein
LQLLQLLQLKHNNREQTEAVVVEHVAKKKEIINLFLSAYEKQDVALAVYFLSFLLLFVYSFIYQTQLKFYPIPNSNSISNSN